MPGDYGNDYLTLSDDEGVEYNFEVLDRIETDEARYVALTPVYDDPKEQLDYDGELVIMRVVEDGDEDCLEPVTDDDEFDTVSEAFQSRLEELYEIE